MSHDGGCFCGEIRYRAEGAPLRVMHCHCTICRRVSGAPVVTWITFAVDRFRWTKGSPARLKSTPPASRWFCPACGTHMAFEIDGAKELDITVGSLDRPAEVEPGYHIFADTRLPWLRLEDRLPAYDDWGPSI
jgi:hypothetical protein